MSSGPSRPHWWTVAQSEDVVEGALLAVNCDGGRYALFRDAAGVVRAVHDECAHRRAPLSLGRVTAEGLVECPYHGWRYDGASGACAQIPNLSSSERVPRAYRVPAFAVAERDGFIHLWPQGLSGDEQGLSDLALDAGPAIWRGAALLAYPCESFVDLLLDAPGAVLDIPSVSIADRHAFGDPIVEDGHVVVEYAAAWTSRRKVTAKDAVADYPLAVRVAVKANGRTARVDLRTDAGERLSSAYVAAIPVRATVTGAIWRGAGLNRAGGAIQIGVRTQIAAQAVVDAYAYASDIRRDLGDEQRVQRA